MRNSGSIAGKLKVVDFGENPKLERDGGSRFRAEGTPSVVEKPDDRARLARAVERLDGRSASPS